MEALEDHLLCSALQRLQPTAAQHERAISLPEAGIRLAMPVTPPLWSVHMTLRLCGLGEEQKFEGKAELLDRSLVTGVRRAVEYLNGPEAGARASAGFCVVFSESEQHYFLMYTRSRKDKVLDLFGFEETWSEGNSVLLCSEGEEYRFEGKAELLCEVRVSTLHEAAEYLNGRGWDSCGGYCVVYIPSTDPTAPLGSYHLMYRLGDKAEAFSRLDLYGLDRRTLPAQQPISLGGSLVRTFAASASSTLLEIAERCRSGLACRSEGFTDCYEIVRTLGTGAQGSAHLVRRKSDNQDAGSLVVKECHDMTPAGVRDFLREFERMRALDHPNCVKVVDKVESWSWRTRQLFIVMEFARGGDLYSYMQVALQNNGLTERHVAGLFQQAMRGVAFLHEKWITHNDLKPDNLLVMEEFSPHAVPRVVISDYGCMRTRTGERHIFGDPSYQAPESWEAMVASWVGGDHAATPELGPKIDIWSMGVTLYELLSGGVLPFVYESRTATDVLKRLKEALLERDGRVQIEPHCPDASAEVALLLGALLDRDAERRPSAQDTLGYDWFSAHSEEPMPGSVHSSSL